MLPLTQLHSLTSFILKGRSRLWQVGVGIWFMVYGLWFRLQSSGAASYLRRRSQHTAQASEPRLRPVSGCKLPQLCPRWSLLPPMLLQGDKPTSLKYTKKWLAHSTDVLRHPKVECHHWSTTGTKHNHKFFVRCWKRRQRDFCLTSHLLSPLLSFDSHPKGFLSSGFYQRFLKDEKSSCLHFLAPKHKCDWQPLWTRWENISNWQTQCSVNPPWLLYQWEWRCRPTGWCCDRLGA